MDNIHFFEILHIFVSKHVDVTLEELLNIEEALHYYKRLNAKTLDDITRAMSTDHKQVAKIASELEIFRYKDHTLPKQRSLIIEKFNAVFSKRESCDNDDCSYNNADEVFIQAPLKIGRPMEIQLHDDIDYDKCLPNGDNLEFEEDNKGFRTIPKLSSVIDFFEMIVKKLYYYQYRCFKLYKGKYYKYTQNKWELIASLEEDSKDLYCIICNNTRNRSSDLNKMYMYIERYDVFKMKVRKIVLKCLEKQVKTYSEVSFTVSTVEEVSVEEEQKEEEADVMQTAEDSPVFRSAMQFSMFNKRNKNDNLEYTPKSFFTAHK